jgi:hypothetical protein
MEEYNRNVEVPSALANTVLVGPGGLPPGHPPRRRTSSGPALIANRTAIGAWEMFDLVT